MKKQQVDHVLRAAGRITGEKRVGRTEWLNAIGQDSPFHQEFGYYAGPVEETTAVLPAGWKGRLENLPPGDTEGVTGLCLDPHDLAISKYVARREKDLVFTRELARRGLVVRETLFELLRKTPLSEEGRERIRVDIARDFERAAGAEGKPRRPRRRK